METLVHFPASLYLSNFGFSLFVYSQKNVTFSKTPFEGHDFVIYFSYDIGHLIENLLTVILSAF